MIRPSAAEQGNATSERCQIGDLAGLQNVLSLHLGWIHPVGRPFSHGIDCPPPIRGQPFVDSLSCCCPGPKNIAPHSNDFVLAGLAHLLPDDVYFVPFSYRLTFLDRFIWSPVVCDPCPQCLIRNRTISQSNKLC